MADGIDFINENTTNSSNGIKKFRNTSFGLTGGDHTDDQHDDGDDSTTDSVDLDTEDFKPRVASGSTTFGAASTAATFSLFTGATTLAAVSGTVEVRNDQECDEGDEDGPDQGDTNGDTITNHIAIIDVDFILVSRAIENAHRCSFGGDKQW